jgi:hypothetical protein
MNHRKTSFTIIPDFVTQDCANTIINLMRKSNDRFASDKTDDGRQVSQDNVTAGNMSWGEAPTKLRNGATYYIPIFSADPPPVEKNGFTVNYKENTELWEVTDTVINSIRGHIAGTYSLDTLQPMATMLRYGVAGANIPPHQDGPMLNGGTWVDIDFSCFIVLNDDFEGGALRFEELGLRWEPVAGSAIFLSNTSTKNMVHEVEKVISGERFSINTFWTAS